MPWDLSCKDWEARLRAGRSLVPDLPFLDQSEGGRAVAIFNALRLHDVEGQPRLGPRLKNDPPDMACDAAGDWFRDIVRALFGSLDRATGERMIRELFLLVPKKNSKTTNGALMMLTALLMNRRPGAPFGLTAPVQDVTEVAFNAIEQAIELDDVLKKTFHVRSHLKTIVHRNTKATLEVMTFDPKILTGQKWLGLLMDEVHVCAKMPRAASALRQVRGGMVAFAEAFLAMITTQSEEPPQGIFASELRAARAIRDGTETGKTLAVLYELPPSIQLDKRSPPAWQDPEIWKLVTPNLGRSITLPRLFDLFDQARKTGEAELKAWASQHINLEIGLALGSASWVGARHWEKNGDPGLTLDEVIRRSEVLTVGIDGGGLDDLLGLSVLGRDRETKDWLSWSRAWCHEGVLTLRLDIAEKLQDLANDGDLVIVPDESTDDLAELAGILEKVRDSGLLDKAGIDPAGIGGIVDELVGVGFTDDEIVGISQGWKMAGAVKTAERKLASGQLRHGARRLMAWVLGNAKVELRGNAVLITKQISGVAKIDPLSALLNAIALMSLNPQPKAAPSVIVL